MKFFVSLFVLMALLSSCGKHVPPNDGMNAVKVQESDAASDAQVLDSGAMVAPPSTHENESAIFSVVPGHVYACPGKDRTISKVSWKVKDPTVTTVDVLINSSNDESMKLFAQGGATGDAVTGNWVGAGVKFHLVDVRTKKVLATHEVMMMPCL